MDTERAKEGDEQRSQRKPKHFPLTVCLPRAPSPLCLFFLPSAVSLSLSALIHEGATFVGLAGRVAISFRQMTGAACKSKAPSVLGSVGARSSRRRQTESGGNGANCPNTRRAARRVTTRRIIVLAVSGARDGGRAAGNLRGLHYGFMVHMQR